jgi:hypothetical protein
MENWHGPVDQLGYVVDDTQGAMTHWVERLGWGLEHPVSTAENEE